MLCFNELRGLAVDFRHRIDQIGRVKLVTAVVTLVAAGTGSATNWAGTFDVTVRQRATGRRGNRTHRGLLDHVAVFVEPSEELLDNRVVVARGGARKQVVGKPQPREVLHNLAVVTVGQLLDRNAFLLRLHKQWRAMLISTGDHQHVIANHSLVASENVRRDTKTCNMADMSRTVSVRPRNCCENARHI